MIWMDNQGAVYTADKKWLLKVPNVKRYMIREGTECVADDVFVGCDLLECIYIPYTCPADSIGDIDWCNIGYISFWDEPYLPEEENPDANWYDGEQIVRDEKNVMYVNDGKRLLGTYGSFLERRYVVPDGVVTICDRAFIYNEQYLELSVPRSVKVIGSEIFSQEGGRIVFRG